MDGPGHLLSLKVMRVSRPALATAWEPFYSSSPSFSAHSTESILSLQGNTPLPGHPKTLRDLTNVSELLTLPASFGAIQLGETFSGVLAVNNETAATVDGVLLRVEMQTASNKISLLELGGELQSLAAGDTLEAAVSHEIKELGQHVLACTVTYKLPPGSRQPKSESNNPDVQLFRKFYKFTVSNPLSVKTKVHVPKSPAGMLSRQEREKVFLEVHIQNMTPEPMSFERILLDPAPGWNVEDINTSPGSAATEKETLFSGSMAMMLPQDARQYLYILTPTQPSEFLVQPTPGSVIPLGRLDLSWRSSFGEPGRLLTSMLSRRIPLVAPTQVSAPRQQPASALPPHIQRSQSAAAQPPSRPGSPQISTPTTPVPYRPASPRVKTNSIASITSTLVQAPPATPQSHALPPEPLDIDLAVINAPREPVPVEIPLLMKFSIGLSATVPEGRRRTISLAIQHVELPRPALRASRPAKGVPGTASQLPSPRLTHGGPGSMSSVQLGLAVSAPSQFVDNPAVLTDSPRVAHAELASDASKQLPRPVPMPGDEEKYASLSSARYLGSSVRFLPPFTLEAGREPVFSEFEATWLPVVRGFVRIGGLRVIVVEDSSVDAGTGAGVGGDGPARLPRVLKEWDVVGEVWVS